jgi:hypothetical protein
MCTDRAESVHILTVERQNKPWVQEQNCKNIFQVHGEYVLHVFMSRVNLCFLFALFPKIIGHMYMIQDLPVTGVGRLID